MKNKRKTPTFIIIILLLVLNIHDYFSTLMSINLGHLTQISCEYDMDLDSFHLRDDTVCFFTV